MVAFDQPILLTLTIPTGATTDERIVIDGIDGVIDIYNTANQKTIELGEGIIQVGFSPHPAIILSANGTDAFGNQVAQIQLPTFGSGEVNPSAIYSTYDSSFKEAALALDGPANSGTTIKGFWEINLIAGSDDGLGDVFQPAFTLLYYSDNTFANGTAVISAGNNFLGFGAAGSAPAVIVDSAWPIIVDQAFTPFTLANGWSVVAGRHVPGFRLMPDGTVLMRGSLTGGTTVAGTPFAALPVGYRPDLQLFLNCNSNGTSDVMAITILANGNLQISSALGSTSFALDGCRFPTAAIS